MNFRGKATWVGISFIVLVVVAVGVLVAWRTVLHHQAQTRAEGYVTIYTCPMHSNVVSDTPGTCPSCGMKLMPMQRLKDKAVPAAAAPTIAPGTAPQAPPSGKE